MCWIFNFIFTFHFIDHFRNLYLHLKVNPSILNAMKMNNMKQSSTFIKSIQWEFFFFSFFNKLVKRMDIISLKIHLKTPTHCKKFYINNKKQQKNELIFTICCCCCFTELFSGFIQNWTVFVCVCLLSITLTKFLLFRAMFTIIYC